MEMNGEDFSQDVQTNEESMNGNDGAGDKATNGDNNGSAEAPGRDDDRYVPISLASHIQFSRSQAGIHWRPHISRVHILGV